MKHRVQSIGDILAETLRDSNLAQPLLERQVPSAWQAVLGDSVGRLTGRMEVRNGVLYVQILSAALKSQLFECRRDIVRKINGKLGAAVLTDIRLLG